MRYHLKEDGTAGVCKATPGNCPKGEAIHGDSVQDVYSKLEAVMKDQLFHTDLFPATKPRPTAREIGADGMLLTYSKPVIVKEQLEALKKLGLLEKALPTLDVHSPVLAAAWRNNQEDVIDYDRLYIEPKRYSYEGSDGGAYTSMTTTWVAPTAYELQTVALHSLMDTLENGELKQEDIEPYRVALGETSESHDPYMAFNYNSGRQDHDFFNNVKNRMVREGLNKKKTGVGRASYTVPSFLWDGMDEESKERFARKMVSDDYAPGTADTKSFHERVLGRNTFGDLLETVFAPKSRIPRVKSGEESNYSLQRFGDSKASGIFTLTDTGFDWSETGRKYV